MIPMLMSLAITASTSMQPYSKYACKQVITNGVAVSEPYYGTAGDYNNQPITLPDHILAGTNATTPINLVQLSQYWKATIVGGGDTNFFFTHDASNGVEVQGTSVILKNALINSGSVEANISINTYSTACAELLANYLKTNNYTYLYSMTINVTQQQMKQILQQMDSNSTINSMITQELNQQMFHLGESEASYIATKATGVAYYNPQDIFKEGNKLVEEGKIKGTGMQIPANTPDLMQVPDGSSYNQAMAGILYSFPPQPKNVPQNTQTVAQYQQSQAKEIQKNNSVSTPVAGVKPIPVPAQVSSQPPTTPVQNNSQQPVQQTTDSGINWAAWILGVGGVLAAICFGIAGFIWYKQKREQEYEDDDDDYPEFR